MLTKSSRAPGTLQVGKNCPQPDSVGLRLQRKTSCVDYCASYTLYTIHHDFPSSAVHLNVSHPTLNSKESILEAKPACPALPAAQDTHSGVFDGARSGPPRVVNTVRDSAPSADNFTCRYCYMEGFQNCRVPFWGPF